MYTSSPTNLIKTKLNYQEGQMMGKKKKKKIFNIELLNSTFL